MNEPLEKDPLDKFLSQGSDARKAHRRATFGWALVALAFAVGMIVALITVSNAYDNQREDNRGLQDDNAELRRLVIAQNSTIGQNTARTNCRTQYANKVTETQSIFLLDIGDALIAIATREQEEFAAALDALRLSRDEYESAVAARLAYEDRAAPLPCPISSND